MINKTFKLILLITILFSCNSKTFSQDINAPKDGFTYARAFSPGQFIVQATQSKLTPSVVRFVKTEAMYDTITMGLMAHSGNNELLTDVYDFRFIGEKLIVSSNNVSLIEHNEEFDIRNEIQNKAANKWSLSNLALCDSPENDCDLFDWVEIPVTYINQSPLGKSTANDNKLKTSVAFFNIQRDNTEELTPVEYFFYTKVIQIKEEQNLIIETPATYETVFNKVQSSNDLISEWVEVIPLEKLDEILIQQIQLALKGRNKYKGSINGIWTPKTQNALEHFQIKNDLYVGQLDKSTLEKLGFSFSLLRFSNNSDTNL